MLNLQDFADVLYLAAKRSGLADGGSIAEAGYVSMAGTVLEYLKANLEVTVPAEAFRMREEGEASSDVKCRIS